MLLRISEHVGGARKLLMDGRLCRRWARMMDEDLCCCQRSSQSQHPRSRRKGFDGAYCTGLVWERGNRNMEDRTVFVPESSVSPRLFSTSTVSWT